MKTSNPTILKKLCRETGRLCGLMVRGQGSIPGAWEVMGLKRGPLSLVSTIEKLFERKSRSRKAENTAVGDPQHWLHNTPLSGKAGTNFADKRWSLGRYNSFSESGHRVFLFFFYIYRKTCCTQNGWTSVVYCFPFVVTFEVKYARRLFVIGRED
jgi:hypothetical protein